MSLTNNNESHHTRLQHFISFAHVTYYPSIHFPDTAQYTDKWIWLSTCYVFPVFRPFQVYRSWINVGICASVNIRIYDIGHKPRCKWNLSPSRYYPAQIYTQLPTFRNNPSVVTKTVKQSKKMGPICCPETSVTPYQSTSVTSQKSEDFKIHTVIFSAMAACSLVGRNPSFGETYCIFFSAAPQDTIKMGQWVCFQKLIIPSYHITQQAFNYV